MSDCCSHHFCHLSTVPRSIDSYFDSTPSCCGNQTCDVSCSSLKLSVCCSLPVSHASSPNKEQLLIGCSAKGRLCVTCDFVTNPGKKNIFFLLSNTAHHARTPARARGSGTPQSRC